MKNLLSLVKRDASGFRIENTSATKAEIIIYAGIGQDFWDDGSMISAKNFSDELKKIDASVNEIVVRINSPGGDVFDGMAIYNRLKQHKAKKTVYIDGLAASIASIIALAGDDIFIGEGALYMIHLPWTFAYGNRMELDNTVNRLMDVEEQITGIYAKKTGLDRSEIKALLEAETWMDAEEAIEKGFVTSKVEDSVPIAASAIGSKWINKKPTKYFSQTAAVDTAKNDLRNKILDRVARK
jgi:ATP-dependent protease ClpP protease subunit